MHARKSSFAVPVPTLCNANVGCKKGGCGFSLLVPPQPLLDETPGSIDDLGPGFCLNCAPIRKFVHGHPDIGGFDPNPCARPFYTLLLVNDSIMQHCGHLQGAGPRRIGMQNDVAVLQKLLGERLPINFPHGSGTGRRRNTAAGLSSREPMSSDSPAAPIQPIVPKLCSSPPFWSASESSHDSKDFLSKVASSTSTSRHARGAPPKVMVCSGLRTQNLRMSMRLRLIPSSTV